MSNRASITAKTTQSKKRRSVSGIRETAIAKSKSSPADQILYLQRTIGNHAVQKMIQAGQLQPKFKDEQAAESVPGNMINISAAQVQRQTEADEQTSVRRRPMSASIIPLAQRRAYSSYSTRPNAEKTAQTPTPEGPKTLSVEATTAAKFETGAGGDIKPSHSRKTTSEVIPGGKAAKRKPEGVPSKKTAAGPVNGKKAAGRAAAESATIKSPREAIAPAFSAIRHRAASARRHPPASEPVAAAQAAGINPKTEQTRTAAAQTVTNLDADAEKAEKVKRDEFKANLKEAIEAATPQPKTESQAEKVMKTGAADARNNMRRQLAIERDAATGPLKSTADTEVSASAQPAPPEIELQQQQVGQPPKPVSAAFVVPASLPPERLDYSSDRASTDQVMAENNVTKEQLEEGNEPAFGPALKARTTAEKHENTAKTRYRQSESKVQEGAQRAAQKTLGQGLAGMHSARELKINKVVGQQLGTKSKSLGERQKVTDRINAIKDRTRSGVNAILDGMETEASSIFEAGLKRAEQAYEDTFEEAKGGVGTWLTTWGSDWEKLIEKSLAKARREYLRQVNKAVDEVADLIEAKLKAAKQCIADGRTEVDDFVKGLDDSVRQYGEEALQEVNADFDAMGSEIDQRRDGIIDKLAQQYKSSYERMSAMEEKLREENKSLWQRVYDATVGVIKKIIEVKNMLLKVLAKVSGVVGSIIRDPIGFLGNLIQGLKQGFQNFVGHIKKHLISGLIGWLTGSLGSLNITLPEDIFSLKGIFSLVMQVLGLTWDYIRAKAVKLMGEPVVKALETAFEPFKILITEGPAGLWGYVKAQFSDLKEMVMDQIKDMVIVQVIQAGVKWLMGLLNPVGAFIKAAMAIYDIVMFFIEKGSQIMELVSSIIDAVGAIAKGAIGGAARMVENALAKFLPLVIGFLASLAGVGGLANKVKTIIKKLRSRIDKAINNVLIKAKKVGRKLFKKTKVFARKAGLKIKGTVGKLADWWTIKFPIKSKNNEQHILYFSGSNENAFLMIASRGKGYKEYLKTLKTTNDRQKAAKEKAIKKGEKIDRLKIELAKLHRQFQDPEKHKSIKIAADEKQDHMVVLMREMTDQIEIVIDGKTIPEERYLPPGLSVRRKLYIKGSSFASLSKKLRNDKVKYINEKFKQIRNAQNEDTKKEIWEKLSDAELVPNNVERDKFVKKNIKASKLNVDHVGSLAKHWKDIGYNTSDEERQRYASLAVNFDVIHETYNKSKGSEDEYGYRHYYVENFFVGKRFSSMDNKSPFGSLKIDGKYFRKTLNGESYNK